MNSRPVRRAALVSGMALLLLAGVSRADPFTIGDIFAAQDGGLIQHFNSAGTLLETLNTGTGGFETGMAVDGAGNLYTTNFSVGSVTRFTGPGDPHTPSIWLNQGGAPESIVFDKSGNMFVSSSSTGYIGKYDSAGTFLTSYNTGSRADFVELSADNTKLYFTVDSSKGVYILDLATSMVTPFSGVGNFALRLLKDGTILVANYQDVKRIDSTGAVIQTYDVAGEDTFFALNLDPNGTSFWSGDFGTGKLYRFNIATGALEQTINTGAGGSSLYGVAVFGEVTTGGPPPGPHMPEPALGLLALLAGLSTWGRLRAKRA